MGTDCVVVEKNAGGEMATSVLKTADPAFPELEDELCAMIRGGGYARSRSPDRADAMVWAMTELMLAPTRAEPRVRRL